MFSCHYKSRISFEIVRKKRRIQRLDKRGGIAIKTVLECSRVMSLNDTSSNIVEITIRSIAPIIFVLKITKFLEAR